MSSLTLRKLLACVAISLTSASVMAAPSYIVNTYDKKVIKAPHVFEFDTDFNKNRHFFCGHAALSSALAAFGVPRNIKELHEDFMYIEEQTNNYDYNTNKYNNQPCPFCADIRLLNREVTFLREKKGHRIHSQLASAHDKDAYFTQMKDAIDNGQVAVSLSKRYHNDGSWHNTGHFFTVHGYRIVNGEKYLYLRDPIMENGGQHTDIHEMPMDELWDNMNIDGQIRSVIIND